MTAELRMHLHLEAQEHFPTNASEHTFSLQKGTTGILNFLPHFGVFYTLLFFFFPSTQLQLPFSSGQNDNSGLMDARLTLTSFNLSSPTLSRYAD